MKKLIFIPILALCLILAGCGGDIAENPADLPVPQVEEEATLPEPEPEPVPEPEPEPELEPEPVEDTFERPTDEPFPILERIDRLLVGSGFEEPITYILDDDQRMDLWSLMRVEDWVVATDLPAIGFSAAFYIYEIENGEWVQTWFFNFWDDQTLIVPWGSGESYFAPLDVIDDVLAFAETLTPQ